MWGKQYVQPDLVAVCYGLDALPSPVEAKCSLTLGRAACWKLTCSYVLEAKCSLALGRDAWRPGKNVWIIKCSDNRSSDN